MRNILLASLLVVLALTSVPTAFAADPTPCAFKAVGVGQESTCGVRSDGTTVCWGRDIYGSSLAPQTPFREVAVAAYGGCGIDADHEVQCWGIPEPGPGLEGTFEHIAFGTGFGGCAINRDHELTCWGLSDFAQTPPPGRFREVSCGIDHACAVREDGTLSCWGSGGGTPPSGIVQQVDAGASHSCAIRSDGTIACWGSNGSGQASPPEGTFRQVSSGAGYSCAVRADGEVVCWGSSADRAIPPGGKFASVTAGQRHTCGVRDDGSIECWGKNDYGQRVAPGAPIVQAAPHELHVDFLREEGSVFRAKLYGGTSIPTQDSFLQIASGGYSNHEFTCGIRNDHTVSCWGVDDFGQSSPLHGSFVQISAGSQFACGLRSAGAIECWGSDTSNQASPPSGTYKQISAGGAHACAIRSDDSIRCWGDDTFGQRSNVPKGSFESIVSGMFDSCGVSMRIPTDPEH